MKFLRIVYSLVSLALLAACAQEITPTGGPKDEIPPKVVNTDPANERLNYREGKVRFFFDEPVRKPDASKDIFISPFVSRPEVILSDNGKRLTIKINEELRPQTTYVITLNGVRDLHESNLMEEPYSLAFSTGDQLDSLTLQGVIRDAANQPVEEMLVLLFDADSVPGNEIYGKSPAYLSRSNSSGQFSFRFLRDTRYRLFGVKDADQSNSYNVPTEMIAIAQDSIIRPWVERDSAQGDSLLPLTSFLPDEDAPRFKSPIWLGDSLFSLTLNEYPDLRTTRFFTTDTSRLDTFPVDDWAIIPGAEPQLWLGMPGRQFWDLHIEGLQDSLGNRVDSVLRISPSRVKLPEKPLPVTPSLDLLRPAWTFMPYRPMRPDDRTYFALTDTARSDSLRLLFPVNWTSEGLTQVIRPQDPEGTQGVNLLLRVDGAFFFGPDSSAADTTFLFPLSWLKPDGYGTLSGSVIPDSSYDGALVLQLLGPDGTKVVRTFRDTTFAFERLLPGEYSFRVIYDEDGNGVWTPGSLTKFRMPERRKAVPGTITIRANWDFADHVVDLNQEQTAQKAEEEAAPDPDANDKGAD